LRVKAASTDMRASIDDLTGKLLREVKEYREKRRNEPRRKAERAGG
jgi:ribosome-associated translation inhibitor RaiA